MMNDKSISILGCGWLGKALAKHLIKNGYKVKGSTTTKSKKAELTSAGIDPYLINISNFKKGNQRFFKSQYFIICITSKSVDNFKNLADEIKNSPIKNVIFISSTSVYKNTSTIVTENDVNALNTSPLLQIEKLFLNDTSFKTTILRFGGLFGYERRPGNFFNSGKVVPDPDTFVNLIHRDDCIRIIERIIEKDIWNEVFNCCANTHPTKRDFYTKAAIDIGNSPPELAKKSTTGYKIISSEKLKKRLNFNFIYNDLMNL